MFLLQIVLTGNENVKNSFTGEVKVVKINSFWAVKTRLNNLTIEILLNYNRFE